MGDVDIECFHILVKPRNPYAMVEILQRVKCHGKELEEQESPRLNSVFNPSDLVHKVFSQVLRELHCFFDVLVRRTLFKHYPDYLVWLIQLLVINNSIGNFLPVVGCEVFLPKHFIEFNDPRMARFLLRLIFEILDHLVLNDCSQAYRLRVRGQ